MDEAEMTHSVLRAAQHNLVMAQLAKPKPTKTSREKKPAKRIPRRKIVEQQLEDMVKLIIFWRDGQVCVQQASDGVRCGNGLAWGHYIAQGQSNWLKYDLGNVFVQCGNHNLLDHNGDKSYSAWFVSIFGAHAAIMLEGVRDTHRGGKNRTIVELEDMLAHYTELYQNRNFVGTDFKSLIEAGYYGYTLRGCWTEG